MSDALRSMVTPIYMPLWLRIPAVILGLAILLPALIHNAVHVWLLVQGAPLPEHTGSDWARFAQIVLGAGIGFPDPVVGMIRAWRTKA